MAGKSEEVDKSEEKPSITLPGSVEKIIPAIGPIPERAQIAVHTAEDLYKEIRIENTFEDADGNPVSLKKGAEVEVTIAADPADTEPKKGSAAPASK